MFVIIEFTLYTPTLENKMFKRFFNIIFTFGKLEVIRQIYDVWIFFKIFYPLSTPVWIHLKSPLPSLFPTSQSEIRQRAKKVDTIVINSKISASIPPKFKRHKWTDPSLVCSMDNFRTSQLTWSNTANCWRTIDMEFGQGGSRDAIGVN